MDVLVDGLTFGEGPRWHEGRLWLSDFHTESVLAVDIDGNIETVVLVPGQPSGLGWMPDGALLVVSIRRRRLYRLEDGMLVEHADLSGLASFGCNDMVVDRRGRAYVGCCDLDGIPEPKPSELIVVDPDGNARVGDAAMRFPNGSVMWNDDSTLIVAETFGSCLTAFNVDANGDLSGKREWAALNGGVPDGICIDAEGAIWYADPSHRGCVRVREGGEVAQRVETERACFACALGGPDGRSLFLVTGSLLPPEEALARRRGRVEVVEVEVPAVPSL